MVYFRHVVRSLKRASPRLRFNRHRGRDRHTGAGRPAFDVPLDPGPSQWQRVKRADRVRARRFDSPLRWALAVALAALFLFGMRSAPRGLGAAGTLAVILPLLYAACFAVSRTCRTVGAMLLVFVNLTLPVLGADPLLVAHGLALAGALLYLNLRDRRRVGARFTS